MDRRRRTRLRPRPDRRPHPRPGRAVRRRSSGLPTLADNGYDGAGIGIHTPIKQPEGNHVLGPDNRTYNRLLRALRCLGERGFALLKGRWRTLQHITVSPGRIGDIARAALVLTHFEHDYLPGIR